jgi:hypothetical protein
MKDKHKRSFVAMMVVIGFSALLLRAVTSALIRFNAQQNESHAKGTLKLIAASLERYANDNGDKYPVGFSQLTESQPAYLEEDYISLSPVKGYSYGCSQLDPFKYSCYARPDRCGLTGKSTFTITTGALFTEEACRESD